MSNNRTWGQRRLGAKLILASYACSLINDHPHIYARKNCHITSPEHTAPVVVLMGPVARGCGSYSNGVVVYWGILLLWVLIMKSSGRPFACLLDPIVHCMCSPNNECSFIIPLLHWTGLIVHIYRLCTSTVSYSVGVGGSIATVTCSHNTLSLSQSLMSLGVNQGNLQDGDY